MVAERFVATLVHDYLGKKKYISTANEFFKENGMNNNRQTQLQVEETLPSLEAVVEEYLSYKKMEKECCTKELIDIVQSLKSQLELVKVQLRLLTMKKALGRIVRKHSKSGGNTEQKTHEIDASMIQKMVSTLPCAPSSTKSEDIRSVIPTSTTISTTVTSTATPTEQHDPVVDDNNDGIEDPESDIEFAITPLAKQPKIASPERISLSDDDSCIPIDNQSKEEFSSSTTSINKPLPHDCLLVENGSSSSKLPVISNNIPIPIKHQLTSAEVSRVISACVNISPSADGINYSPDIYTTPVKKKLSSSLEPTDEVEYRSPKRKSVHPRRSSTKKLQPAKSSDQAVAIPKMKNMDSPTDELNQLIEALLNAPDLQKKIAENINKAVESALVDEKNKKDEAVASQDLNLSELVDITASDPSFEELFHALEGFGDILHPTDFAQHGTYEALSVESLHENISNTPSCSTTENPILNDAMMPSSMAPSTPSDVYQVHASTTMNNPCSTHVNMSPAANLDNLRESELKDVAMDALLMLAGCAANTKRKEPIDHSKQTLAKKTTGSKTIKRRNTIKNNTSKGFTPLSIHPGHNLSSINIIRLSGQPVNLVTSPHKGTHSPLGIGRYILDKGRSPIKNNKLKRSADTAGSNQSSGVAPKKRQRGLSSADVAKSTSRLESLNMLLCNENQPDLKTIDLAVLNDTRQECQLPVAKKTCIEDTTNNRQESSENISPKNVPKHLNVDEFLSTLNYDD